MSNTILDKIKAYKLEEVAAEKAKVPPSEVEVKAQNASPPRKFYEQLLNASKTGYGLIAEIKKASPSKGLIRADFDPTTHAKSYEAGGATCLSVLTDTPSFQGANDYLKAARAATSLPALRKDFMYDTYQIAQARALGADCILIIMASVSDTQASELEDAAFAWGMDVLIEVHNGEELDRACSLKSPMIGINNRNLKTFETTLETTKQLSRQVPEGRLLISESGLDTPADLAEMAAYGARTFLIGESLMRQPNLMQATRNILANPVKGGS